MPSIWLWQNFGELFWARPKTKGSSIRGRRSVKRKRENWVRLARVIPQSVKCVPARTGRKMKTGGEISRLGFADGCVKFIPMRTETNVCEVAGALLVYRVV